MNPPGDPSALLLEIREKLEGMDKVDLIVSPPFTGISQAAEVLKGTGIDIAGQNLYWEQKGAFTGEISASMLSAAGATHVIIGHSERRQYFGETDMGVNRRIKAALESGLKPILCLGETERERENGITFKIIQRQFEGAMKGIPESSLDEIMIAYEPVWAIGTGKVANPSDAQEIHQLLRELLVSYYSESSSINTSILYGGSVKPDNAENLFREEDIDGALVGGASLSPDSFAEIAQIAVKLS